MHVFNDYWIAEKLSSLSLLSHTSASWSLLLKNVVVEKDRIWPMAITFAVIKCVQCYCCSHCVCSTTLLWNVANTYLAISIVRLKRNNISSRVLPRMSESFIVFSRHDSYSLGNLFSYSMFHVIIIITVIGKHLHEFAAEHQ